MRRAFAKILRILLAAATVFAGSILEGTAKKEVLRLDASSEEKMQQSFFKMLMALDDTDQQKFSSAKSRTTLSVTKMENSNLTCLRNSNFQCR